MKIAVLADIHGNHFALANVLASAKDQKVERVWVLGDIVGYYYGPEIALQQLKEWDFLFIRGNHEEILNDVQKKKKTFQSLRSKYGSSHQVAMTKLTQGDLDFVTQSPQTMTIDQDGRAFMICHGSPSDPDLYLYPDSDNTHMASCEVPGVDIVFVGHSHYSFSCQVGKTQLVNVGSVGQNRSQGGVASWVILNTENGSVQFKATPYDIRPLISEINNRDPEICYLKNVLMRNNPFYV